MSKLTSPVARPTGFFVLRTPLLPHDELVAWTGELRAAVVDEASPALREALAADRRGLRERLRALVARPEIREALFVASPSLDESLPLWLDDPTSERGQKVERTLVRYLSRMTCRPTPFGLFAGCSVGALGGHTHLRLDARRRYQRHTRLDSDYLSALAAKLGTDPAIRRASIYRPNSSLYRLAGRLRYVESRRAGKCRSYHLVSVQPSDYLEATLARAQAGARLDALAEALLADFGGGEATRAEAEQFIAELVDSQLLVSDLEPPVTGPEPIHELIAQLGAGDATAEVADALAEARDALAALDQTPLGAPAAGYRAVAAGLDRLPVEVELARLFQVDMVKPAPRLMLGPEPVDEIVRAVSLLHRIGRATRPTALARFADAFAARYEQREMPLPQVLDEENGIGFLRSTSPSAETSLLAGLDFGGAPAADTSTGPHFGLLLHKLERALRSGAQEIVLDDADIERMSGNTSAQPPPLPDSLSAMVTLVASSEEAIANRQFTILLRSLFGPSGVSLLGRFCHGDAALEAHVRAHLQLEEARRPDAIFAEIVHLPEGRIGNVILRPLLRQWEVAFLGRSGAPPERQILLDDLLVSARSGRVILRSQRLGREVIPRLTTAHNFSSARNLGAYRFLCALQAQDAPSLSFDWGALASASFLPRVRCGRVVLAQARWRLEGDELAPLARATGDRRYVEARALARKHRLPRWIAVADGDNLLPVDLDNVLSVETFVQLVKERSQLLVTELGASEGLCVAGPEGRFTHELILPLIASEEAARSSAAPAAKATPDPLVPPAPSPAAGSPPARPALPIVPRRLPPGSEWLYAKLYAGSTTCDRLLREAVAPLVARTLDSGAADAWFFLRYSDPDWHIRLRFHGEPERLRGELLPLLEAAAAEATSAGTVWRFQLDTYEREIERYGGHAGIRLSEQLFFADSDAALGIVAGSTEDDGENTRWPLALHGMHQLLDDLGLSLAQKHALSLHCRDSLRRELEVQPALERQIGAKFRQERRTLEALLDPAGDGGALTPGVALLARRSERVRPIAAALAGLAAAGKLSTSLPNLAASFVHMHVNRVLPAAARTQEMVLYDFLERLLRGQLARERGQSRT